jgi:class 3 adenylate cyclase/CheY-like chemotaxis protein
MISPEATAEDAMDAPETPIGAGPARARRLYLTRRRHELLAQVHAILDVCDLLLREEKVAACARVAGDLQTVRNSAGRVAAMVLDVLGPERLDTAGPLPEATAKALNHDLRSLLTIVLTYGEELRRAARKYFLEDFAAELEQVRSLGRRAVALVDSTVTQLRSPEGCGAVDGAQAYLDRMAGTLDEPADDAPEAPAAEPGLILVAEDNDDLRRRLCELLADQGHEVVAARDGAEAIERIGTRPFDLLLTDIEMPRANGFQVIDHLKADPQLRDVPVIVISGHGELDGIAYCIKRGAEDYLPKPFNRTLLKARVDACLEKKRLRDRHERQRKRFDELLHEILPAPVVAELCETHQVKPRRRDEVAVLFADIVDFTPFCDRHHDRPEVVVGHLGRMFEAWESIASDYRVQKIKTIGDAFMAASGLLEDAANPVLDCVACGLRMIRYTQDLRDERGEPLRFNLRVGIHVGPVVAGVLGRRSSLYDLWGDTVNTAARLESHGDKGCINLSADAWARVADHVRGRWKNGPREIKGKGMMELFHLDPATVELRTWPGPA